MRNLYLTVTLLLVAALSFAQPAETPTKVVTDNGGQGTGTATWSKDTVYILDGRVFVNDGDVLTIEAGTVIKGRSSEDPQNASVLVVARGGKIMAEGTAAEPIIFTAENDDVTVAGDVEAFERGLWGGVIVLGRASTNRANVEGQIEGIEGDPRGAYGGSDDADDSGVLKYVSIRHGGIAIAPDNEINGLTLGAVGTGTTIEHIEVFANQDDGVEWFGGTVNTKYLTVAFCGDDSFDYDEGFRGKGQFWFTIQDAEGDRGGEHDGGTDPETGEPFATPVVYNATFLGADDETDNSRTMTLRDNAGGQYWNSIFADFGRGIDVEILSSGTHSYDRFVAGELAFAGDIFYNIAAGTTAEDIFTISAGSFGGSADSAATVDAAAADFASSFDGNGNTVDNPMFASVSPDSRLEGQGELDPRPMVGGPAYMNLQPSDDAFFMDVDYKGAFGPNRETWAHGWTALDAYGFLTSTEGEEIVVTDNEGAGTGTDTWTSNNTYILDGRVFVNEGDTLTIEAGTVIKGRASTDPQNASVLVVARGGYIDAQGTAELPIIFTAESDDVTIADDVTPFERGLWGGVIVLGRASTNRANVEGQIEGIEGDARGTYGGDNDEDNSGILKYISIRHGGIAIAPDNEINGLTLGGVGSGTTIEYIEVFANQDDGVEWFGGTVNTKYLAVAYCGDDSYDYDEGFRGLGQYWFTIQDDEGDRGGEHDGGTDPETGEPFAIPRVFNATFFGAGNADDNSRTITFRDNAGGMYRNSIFSDFGRGIDIEFLASGTHSYDRFVAGDLVLENNIFWNINAGQTGAELFTIGGDENAAASEDVAAAFGEGNNIYNNPVFAAWNENSRTPGENAFDPRPASNGFAYRDLATAPDNGFYDQVAFKGAFGEGLWVEGWTAIDAYGFLGQAGGNANPDTLGAPGETIVITDNEGAGTGTTTWTANNTYILDGRVFVNEGDSLTIEPGTVIKGRSSADPQNASVLVVARGGYIDACGTPDQPIIFTAESDDVTIADDVTPFERGLWGGVIVLGRASTNRANVEGQIEGIEGDVRGTYGGDNDEDNSGILKYISIRHGGIAIAPDNEINGLTLGAVGSGTTIEHIEVFANQDDGVEWFGGTVNTKWLSVAYCGDDSFDYDEGFRGKGQFWFTIQDDEGDRGGEHDGGTDPETGEPFAIPRVFNATFFGAGNETDGSRTITFRDNAGGMYKNSVFSDFGQGIDIEFLASGTHSYDRFVAGDLQLTNNVFWNINAGTTGAELFTIGGDENADASADVAAAFDEGLNIYNNPLFAAWNENSRTPGAEAFDPRPSTEGFAYGGSFASVPSDDFYMNVNYKGAFGEDLWVEGWTALDAYGFLGQEGGNANTEIISEEIVVTDNEGEGTGTATWTRNNTYILDGRVFVNEGDTLRIEAGTVIKGRASTDPQNASVLVVARGGYIIACGTETDPIIFTAESDDVTIADDVTPFERGLWGGVIVLGRATTNRANIEGQIEGIEGDARGTYGGDNDDDDSGVLKYISIRHGGIAIAPDNEINGLTLGGVGRGTTIEHIEVFANQDDGVEWFGGTVNTKWLSVAFCGDDSFDYDEGFRGLGQYWFTIQDNEGDRGGEHDGGTDPETGEPFALPRVFNASFFGAGNADDNSRTITFRDNAGGMYKNSIFSDFGRGIDVEFLASGTHSWDRLQAGELALENNIFWNINAGNTGADLFTIGGDTNAVATAEIAAYFDDANNTWDNPSFAAINDDSRTPGAQAFDPRPTSRGAAFEDFADVPDNGFYDAVDFKGAFGPTNLWVSGWTALDAYGFLGQEGGNPNPTRPLKGAVVQIIHNSPDPAVDTVDVYLNGEIAIENFAFREATEFLELPAGTYDIGFGVGDSDTVSVSFDGVPLDSAKYVVIASGLVDTTLCGSNEVNGGANVAFQLSVLTPAESDAPEGQVNVTVFHGSPNAPAVDAVVRGLPVVAVDDIAYGEFQGPGLQPAADLPLNITPADDNNTVLAEITVPLGALNGSAAVAFASGFFNCDSLAEFGFFAALPDGTVVPLSADAVSVADKFDGIQGLNLFPNPTNGMLNITAENLEATDVEISVFDMLGNRVMRSITRPVAGKISETYNLNDLAPAVYLVRVYQGSKLSIKPILIK